MNVDKPEIHVESYTDRNMEVCLVVERMKVDQAVKAGVQPSTHGSDTEGDMYQCSAHDDFRRDREVSFASYRHAAADVEGYSEALRRWIPVWFLVSGVVAAD